MIPRNYWIGVLAQDRAVAAVAGSFAEANNGKAGPLERLRAGDGFAIYSPRASHPYSEPVQAFTALGRVRSGRVYACKASDEFQPYRLDVDYWTVTPAPIRPLIGELTFIRNKACWGAAFRFGFVRVPPADFVRIASALGIDPAGDFPEAAVDAFGGGLAVSGAESSPA